MGLRKRLLLLAGSLVVFNLVLWGIPKLAPEAPGRYEGVAVAEPSKTSPQAPTTTPAPLPSGFPTMEFPPPKIIVPDGESQPIATKFGLTYDIPSGWDNWYDGVSGWNFDDGTSLVFGALGFYEREKCGGEHRQLAMTGMTGRPDADIAEVARAEIGKISKIFSDDAQTSVTVDLPTQFTVDGRPAIRYRADVSNIVSTDSCTPSEARFDIIATPSYATAATALFVLNAARGVERALTDDQIEQIVSTIRRT
ncbi:hypothetical protein [Rhodococcus sp. 14-2470-1b]|uniref:hypothetical protein n=1 Tax=Rhodococcus sp. 14-2470-1b TaxID=2023149 RepID=UPI0020CBCE16|nr:hypothetical protein [Rhodococcus sp. 14-2470-1b]